MGWVIGFSTNETTRLPGVADQSEKRLASGLIDVSIWRFPVAWEAWWQTTPVTEKGSFGNWCEDDNCQDLIYFYSR